MRRAALRAALSSHASAGTLAFVDAAGFGEPSTKQAAALLQDWGQDLPLVVVATDQEEALVKSFRNLERVVVVAPSDLEVAALVWAKSALVTQGAKEAIERRAG